MDPKTSSATNLISTSYYRNRSWHFTSRTQTMTPAETLTAALRERNLICNRNAITSAFDAANDPNGANAEWVTNHVHNDTLLTREEYLL